LDKPLVVGMAWLKQLPLEERLQHAPSYLVQIVEMAKSLLAVKRIWLFGSRARGDARPTSDVDLGFELASQDHWSRFVFDADEEVRSLLHFDFVNMNRCHSDLLTIIKKEGILLYEQPSGT